MSYSGFSYAKKGLIVRLVYLSAALLSFALGKLTGRARGVVVLCYHAVSAQQKTAFERQMRYVAERVVPLVRVDQEGGPLGSVVVTFDDAFQCLIHNVFPVVRPLRVPIAIFAVSESLGKQPVWLSDTDHPDASLATMTADELNLAAQDSLILIGSHTARHRPLGRLSVADVKFELASSKDALQEVLGIPCAFLALPHGSYRPEVIDLAIQQGYCRVLTLDEIAEPSKWPAGTAGRFSASPDMWMLEFKLTVAGAYAWLYPWRAWLRQVRTFLKFNRNAA